MIEFTNQSLLKFIEVSPEFSELMKYKYSVLIPDLTSFASNKNCTCKKKILNHITENLEEVKNLANDFIKTRVDLKFDIDAITKAAPVGKNMRGLSVEIEPNPLAYTEMMKHATEEKWMYRGLSMLETEKKEDGASKVVWIVFFY